MTKRKYNDLFTAHPRYNDLVNYCVITLEKINHDLNCLSLGWKPKFIKDYLSIDDVRSNIQGLLNIINKNPYDFLLSYDDLYPRYLWKLFDKIDNEIENERAKS